MLLSSPGVIVHRHLLDGDGYLVFRFGFAYFFLIEVYIVSPVGQSPAYATSCRNHGSQSSSDATR